MLDLSRLLAVRTLQLEMEHIYRSLEDEALDMTGYDSGVGEDGERRIIDNQRGPNFCPFTHRSTWGLQFHFIYYLIRMITFS